MLPFRCCCWGYLDLFYIDDNGGDLHRGQAVYPDGNIDLSASEALWEMDRDSAGYEVIDQCVIASNSGLLLEVLSDVSEDDWRIQIYDTTDLSIELTHDWNSTSVVEKIGFSDGGAGALRYGTRYKFWNDSFTVTTRGPYVAAPRTTVFCSGISSYSDAGVLNGGTALPQIVSRWNYPRCIGLKISDVTITGWESRGFIPTYWATDFEVDWQCVTGDIDWTTDGPPVINDDTTWFTKTFSGEAIGDSGLTDAANTANFREQLAEFMIGQLVGNLDFTIDAGEYPISPIGGNNPGYSTAKITSSALNAPITGFVSTPHLGTPVEAAVIRIYDKTAGATSVDFYIDGAVEITLGNDGSTLAVRSFSPINHPDYSFATIYNNGTTDCTLYVYDETGTQDWSKTADASGGQLVACSDRHIYAYGFVLDRDDTIGANLPDFTGGSHNPNNGADTWNSWIISIDGTRYVPSRYVDGSGDFQETLWDTTNFRIGDTIKDSTILPLCPPNAWF